MREIIQDITQVESGVIVHQVNCQGVMGSGLALQIARKWPEVYEGYKRVCGFEEKSEDLLGRCYLKRVGDDLAVANLFAQDRYGRAGKRYTSYDALDVAFWRLSNDLKVVSSEFPSSEAVYVPYLLGSDRGGGDWSIVKAIIQVHFPEAIVCRRA